MVTWVAYLPRGSSRLFNGMLEFLHLAKGERWSREAQCPDANLQIATHSMDSMTQVPSVPSEFSRPADLLPLITIHDGVEVFFRHRLIQHRLRLQTKNDTDHTTLAAWSFPPGWSSHHQLRALMPQQCLWVVGGMRMLCGREKPCLSYPSCIAVECSICTSVCYVGASWNLILYIMCPKGLKTRHWHHVKTRHFSCWVKTSWICFWTLVRVRRKTQDKSKQMQGISW